MARHKPMADGRLGHGTVLAIALPIVVSNVTQPLIGVADTAVLGQLGDPGLIGAVALGATIFSMLYWAFGFLRMGTSGLTAQAVGAGDTCEVAIGLVRALMIAAIAGAGLIVLQWPLEVIAFELVHGSDKVEASARSYFAIRIWSAPAALANFAILGWFIGIRRTDLAFWLQLLLNLTNIALDILLTLGLGLGIEGVAIGTLIAEITAAGAGLMLIRGQLRRLGATLRLDHLADRAKLRRTLGVNRDIMIRTLLLLFSFSFFTFQGARAGDLVLAANAVLFHFLMVSAYLLDGFAFAAEVLVGNAVGAGDRSRFLCAVRLSSFWAFAVALCLALACAIAGGWIIDAMTTSAEVRDLARDYLAWAVALPVVGVACFQLDGIYIGATRTADMRNMMIIATAVYLAAWALLTPIYQNHGLWAALGVFFVVRGLTLGARFPDLLRDLFPAAGNRLGAAPVPDAATRC